MKGQKESAFFLTVELHLWNLIPSAQGILYAVCVNPLPFNKYMWVCVWVWVRVSVWERLSQRAKVFVLVWPFTSRWYCWPAQSDPISGSIYKWICQLSNWKTFIYFMSVSSLFTVQHSFNTYLVEIPVEQKLEQMFVFLSYFVNIFLHCRNRHSVHYMLKWVM